MTSAQLASRPTRTLLVAFLAVIALSGGRCNQKPASTPPKQTVVSLEGNDRNGVPDENSVEELYDHIINYRNSQGLSTQRNNTVQGVAQAQTSSNASTGNLTAILNGQDITTRLRAAGLTPGPLGDAGTYILRGYSSANDVMNALRAFPTILQSNRTRLGIGLAGQGNGNYWTVILY